jgi:hypothetical protein
MSRKCVGMDESDLADVQMGCVVCTAYNRSNPKFNRMSVIGFFLSVRGSRKLMPNQQRVLRRVDNIDLLWQSYYYAPLDKGR